MAAHIRPRVAAIRALENVAILVRKTRKAEYATNTLLGSEPFTEMDVMDRGGNGAFVRFVQTAPTPAVAFVVRQICPSPVPMYTTSELLFESPPVTIALSPFALKSGEMGVQVLAPSVL